MDFLKTQIAILAECQNVLPTKKSLVIERKPYEKCPLGAVMYTEEIAIMIIGAKCAELCLGVGQKIFFSQ